VDVDPVWKEQLDSLGFMDRKGLNVFVWPAPWNDRRVDAFAEDSRVSNVFFVNGGDLTGRQERKAETHEKFISLDISLDRDLLSHDIPQLVLNGKIPEIDIELARDPAMTLLHNPKMDPLDKKFSQASDESVKRKLYQKQHEMFVKIMERTALTSQKIIGENGVSIYDTGHFGYNMEASDWKIFFNNSHDKNREIHLEELAKLFSSHFQDIQTAQDPRKEREFFILSNR